MNRSRRIILGGLVYSFTLIIVLIAFSLCFLSHEFQKPGPLTEIKNVEIERGSSLLSIAETLKSSKAIHDPFIFVIGTRVLNAQSQLQAGEYEFGPGMSAKDVMEKIRAGDTVKRRVTIPEGLTSHEVTELLKNIDEFKGEIAATPDEGSLLPGTYDYKHDETRQDIIMRMKNDMSVLAEKFWQERDSDLPFDSLGDAVTLASIVEKETAVPEERKRVAGVFINRLKAGMPLQSDPTVIYGITKGRHENKGQGPLGRRLLSKDLEKDTPYNTYLHAGLPPGPIANPGKDALEATVHPEEHEFLYFVADGKGGHVFAKTLKEHEENVRKWREIRKEQN